MRVVPRYRSLTRGIPRRMRWTRQRTPTRRHLPAIYKPEARVPVRPSARVSLLHLTATVAVCLVVWGLGALFQTYYAGRIYPHVTIDHVPVGGMSRDEALAALQQTETSRVNSSIYVQADNKVWRVTPAQFGARYDSAAAVDRALALNHSGPFLLGGWNELMTVWGGANVALSGAHDPSAVTSFLSQVAATVHTPPQRAVVGVAGDDVAIVREPVDGHELDITGAANVLSGAVNTHDATAVTLPLRPVESALGHQQAVAAVAHAHNLLSAAPLTFVWSASGTPGWKLSRSGLLKLLTFTPRCGRRSCSFVLGIDKDKLAAAFNRAGVANAVDRAPIPASYELFTGDTPAQASVRVLPDSPGDAIDVDRAAAAILQQANAAQGTPAIIPMPTKPLVSNFKEADAVALSFNQAVGFGVIHMPVLDWARLNNVNVAANVISDTIVQPNHTFSVALKAGPFLTPYGYTAGQNRVGSGDVTGANGGVNALASAVLGAAYDAGLTIQRRVHYPYLSAIAAPGLDAMVSYGKHSPDLVFRNTTDHPILIMTTNNGQGEVSIYIFNSAGYAPGHVQGTYNSTVDNPQLTVNPDGTVDATLTRHITVAGKTSQDSLSGHYTPLDP